MRPPLQLFHVSVSLLLLSHVVSAQVPLGRFADFKPITSLADGSFQDCCHPVSPDGLQILFSSSGRGTSAFNIFQASRSATNEPFGPPVRLDSPLNTDRTDAPSGFSSDGLTLYLFSDRTGGRGGNDLYQATRPSLTEPFGAPSSLGLNVNSSRHDSAPVVTEDGLNLFFQRSNPDGTADLWQATRATEGDAFDNASALEHLNSNANDGGPTLSPDGLHLFFSSDRITTNDNQIYVASRSSIDLPFGDPIDVDDFSLGSHINSQDLSFSGFYLSSDWPEIGSKVYMLGIDNPRNVDIFSIPDWDIYEATWVPEPTSGLTALIGALGMLTYRRRRNSDWCIGRKTNDI
jgi:hypothetical protein